MIAPPAGTVTFLMTDIEGSTRMWERYGNDFIPLLEAHNHIVRTALGEYSGYEVKTEGDSFFYVFNHAQDAVEGAVELQQRLHQDNPEIKVRIGIHTGEPTRRDNDYFGPQVNRTARIRDAAHGGMVLISAVTCALVRDEISSDLILVDRGEHRLRDLSSAERLYQLQHETLPQEFPPLRTLEAQPNNLPAQRNSFIGRNSELDTLHGFIAKGSARLITLTGPGGVGKSRLALQVAADHLVDFPDGVWFIPLGALEQADQVIPEIASLVLGQVPLPEELPQALVRFLSDKRTLIVLDSFEHVIGAAPALSDLLGMLPALTCVVTSRSILHISGEQEFNVPSLAEADSLQLFVERGQSARPGFSLDLQNLQLATSICRKLDGLPLAIELAAARLRGMSPSQIAQRLERRFDILSGGGRDLPDRQRTMRAALDWSYEPLTEEERRLFGQLSVFAGGFNLEAAEAICDVEDVMDGIFNLRDHSLIYTEEQLSESRCYMLTLVREYAAEKVDDHESLRERHANYFLKVAQDWGARVSGRDQRIALARLDIELPNFEAALHWADENRNWKMVAEYVGALGEFGYTRGRITPFIFQVVKRAVTELQGSDDTASQATLLFAMGAIAWMDKRYEEGEACVALSLKYYRANLLHARACRALSLLGLIAADQGRADLARVRFHEGLALCEEADCLLEKGLILQNLSLMELSLGNLDAAQSLAEQGLSIHRAWGDEVGASYQLHTLGLLAWRHGDFKGASNRIIESLESREAMRDLPGIAHSFNDLGKIELERGNLESGVFLLLCAQRLETECLLPTGQEYSRLLEGAKEQLEQAQLTSVSTRAAETPIKDIIAHACFVAEGLAG
jgi:predicted ATPase/class 3 adenylate cyclase